MKHKILMAVLLFGAEAANGGDKIYRCNNEYTNTVTEGNPKGCRSLETVAVPQNWQLAAKSRTEAFYIDPATKKHAGKIVKVWVLVNLEESKSLSSGQIFSSMKSYDEFDCVERQSRSVYFISYSAKSGQGDVVITINDPKSEWAPVDPQSVQFSILEMACK